jgi:hypothetical protein
MSTFTMSIETTEFQSHQHPYHLGTNESVARICVEDCFHARLKHVMPTLTIALMRDGKVFDVYYGRQWNSDIELEAA